MKNMFFKYIMALGLVCAVSFTSCMDFEELNTNPTLFSKIDPNLQLTNVQLQTFGNVYLNEGFMNYGLGLTQIMMGAYNVVTYGGQYRMYQPYFTRPWQNIYQRPVKNAVDIIQTTKDDPTLVNLNSIARVMRVYFMTILTDLYGDVPYSEAGLGYYEGKIQPKYDSQKDIYYDMMNELKEVVASLDPDALIATGDVVFQGDVNKWRRYANSLRLRLAMRLTKADPDKAKAEVIDILSNGYGLLQRGENPLINYMNVWNYAELELRANGQAMAFHTSTYANPQPYVCATFWNYLNDNNDPRLFRLCRNYDQTNLSVVGDPYSRFDATEEIRAHATAKFQPRQPGQFVYSPWPSAYWSATLKKNVHAYTMCPQFNQELVKPDAPGVLMTYAEAQFLLAEAKVRWGAEITGATAAQCYENGVNGAMDMMAVYRINAVPQTETDAYLLAHPLPSVKEDALEALGYHIWALNFYNGPEAFSTWRRTGYPKLTPSTANTVDSKEIPRKYCYPLSEESYNKANFDKAIQAMGGSNSWNNRVWWDKE